MRMNDMALHNGREFLKCFDFIRFETYREGRTFLTLLKAAFEDAEVQPALEDGEDSWRLDAPLLAMFIDTGDEEDD